MSKPTFTRLAALLLDEIATARITLRRRIECTRTGHELLCITDGHLCRRCGRVWC